MVVDGLAAFACATIERTADGARRQLLCRSLWQRVCARSVSTAVLTAGAEYFASVFLAANHGVVRPPAPHPHCTPLYPRNQPRRHLPTARSGSDIVARGRAGCDELLTEPCAAAPQEMLSLEAFSLCYGLLAAALLALSIWSLVVNLQARRRLGCPQTLLSAVSDIYHPCSMVLR